MTPTRTPEDYARDVGAAQVALDKAQRRLDVRNAIDGLLAKPITADIGAGGLVVQFYERREPLYVRNLPRELTTRMHAAIADILADYLRDLEKE